VPNVLDDIPCVKLPNGVQAHVDPGKIRDYLLSDVHPVGRHKAKVFRRLGFDRRNWHALLREVIRIARDGVVVDRMLTIYGIKYVVDDRIQGPAGASDVRTVWILERGRAVPRFVTAYLTGDVDEGT
jgi:hypothetical protein